MSAIAVAVGAGALVAANASQSAANTQAGAANNATNAQLQMYNQATGALSPYTSAGYNSVNTLSNLLGIGNPNQNPAALNFSDWTAQGNFGGDPWPGSGAGPGDYTPQQRYSQYLGVMNQGYTPSQSQKASFGSLIQPFNAQTFQQYQDPAYQWQLQQGNQALINSQAAGNGVLSGASLKDLIAYNQGMANTAYNNAFNQYQTQQGNIYQRLLGVTGLGQASAAGQAANAMTTGSNIGSNILGAGNAQAAGQIGSANAINSGLNNLSGYYMWNNINSGGGGATSPTGPNTASTVYQPSTYGSWLNP